MIMRLHPPVTPVSERMSDPSPRFRDVGTTQAPSADVSSPTVTPDVVGRYLTVRRLTEAYAARLSPEDQVIQSMPDVSPTKWHRAHTTWFFETFVLRPHLPGYTEYDPSYAYLFNSYYEAVGPRHARHARGLISRPSVHEVADYRTHVDAAMVTLLSGPQPREVDSLVELGLMHEQQHQELLLMDILHVLSCNPTNPAYDPAPRALSSPPLPEWRTHAGGLLEIGHGGDSFGFDNEFPRHKTFLEPFSLRRSCIRNSEWLTFIDDGGYQRPEFWLSDGWGAVVAQSWQAPLYWREGDGAWLEFTLQGLQPLDPDALVCHVSHYEADAFARWAGGRLPSEAEWEVAMGEVWDDQPGNDLGTVWEWTSSPYVGYPGFSPASGAVGEYNGKFMSNQQVLRGAAAVTSPGHSRPTYRNFFQPGARWAFSGLRLARDA